jgi:hypothetical protein
MGTSHNPLAVALAPASSAARNALDDLLVDCDGHASGCAASA